MGGIPFVGGSGRHLKMQEGVHPDVCKALDGKPVILSNGSKACIWLKDDSGKPIDVEVANITPGKFKIRHPETGEEIVTTEEEIRKER